MLEKKAFKHFNFAYTAKKGYFAELSTFFIILKNSLL